MSQTHGRVLVVDAGTSGVRAAVVDSGGSLSEVRHLEVLPSYPAQGFVEFDAAEMAGAVLQTASAVLAAAGPVDAVGIANQRASTILWDRASSEPVAPGIGWQDLRTAGTCLLLREEGIHLAPNQSATKLAMLLDMADPERKRDLCYGTVDTWIAWVLSQGGIHATDHSNAGVTGLVASDGTSYDERICERLRIPARVLPRIASSCEVLGAASALAGAPPVTGIAGDQQASLIGQGCVSRGRAKATFGTGGMLDCCLGPDRPALERRGRKGCFPIVAWSEAGSLTWGIEAIMLSAGTCVEWLRDDLGLVASAAETDELAASVPDAGGVYFVPALVGLGTPQWDFGARGTIVGVTRGTTRAHLVRAVLEGIAQRGADLLEAAEADSGLEIATLSVDGGMSENATFVQALADATGRRIAVSAVTEATTGGAAFLAGVGAGIWPDLPTAASLSKPKTFVEPRRRLDRARWQEAVARARGTVPELSALDF